MPDASQPRWFVPPYLFVKRILLALPYRIWRHRITRGLLRRLVPLPARKYYYAYRAGYYFFSKTQVNLYAGPKVLAGGALQPASVIPLDYEHTPDGKRGQPSFSLIITAPLDCVDPGNSSELTQSIRMRSWLDAISQQSRLPEEVVIADRGLDGETLSIIRTFAQASPFPVNLVTSAGKSVPEAINLAIENTAFPLIASTDYFFKPDTNWLENLLYPFEVAPEVQLSAGLIQAQTENEFQRLCAHILLPKFDSETYIPSWRSIAMWKALWVRADGYPEWAGTPAGEILFSLHARQSNARWAVQLGASVSVRMPERLADFYHSCYQKGMADGIPGIDSGGYWSKTLKLVTVVALAGIALILTVISLVLFDRWGWIVPSVLLVAGVSTVLLFLISQTKKHKIRIWLSPTFLFLRLVAIFARLRGFAAGVRARLVAETRRVAHYQDQLQHILDQHPDRKGIFLYPPTHDWGYMFQLPQQMARQFARSGYLYFYNTINEKMDDVTGFRQVEPNLYLCHVPFETFHLLDCGLEDRSEIDEPRKSQLEKLILYIGSPWNRKYLSYFRDALVIYDHYDDLSVSSGQLDDHLHLLERADIVLVTSQRLLDNVKEIRPDTIFAPNGVDYKHFQSLRPAPGEAAPVDLVPILVKGKPVIGYTGALSERFDYDLYRHLVQSRPDYEFLLIGPDVGGSLEHSGLLSAGLSNLHWLGIKSHDELVKYMWQFSVGIVPFKLNEITLATTSIKVFEYMACQVPVVSVAMPESKRYPGVMIAETKYQFEELLDSALMKKEDAEYLAMIDQVARSNTWERRAQTIITMILAKL